MIVLQYVSPLEGGGGGGGGSTMFFDLLVVVCVELKSCGNYLLMPLHSFLFLQLVAAAAACGVSG